MPLKEYPERFATYRGIIFTVVDETATPAGGYHIVTNDESLAHQFNFQENKPGDEHRFEKWIPYRDVDLFVQRLAYGIYKGEQVYVTSEDDHGYVISCDAPLPGLVQVDRNAWDGRVPRSEMERVWVVEKEEDVKRWG